MEIRPIEYSRTEDFCYRGLKIALKRSETIPSSTLPRNKSQDVKTNQKRNHYTNLIYSNNRRTFTDNIVSSAAVE